MKRIIAAALVAACAVALVVTVTAGGAGSTAAGPANWKGVVKARCGALVVNARFLATAVLRDQPIRAHNRAVKIRVRARTCAQALRQIPGG